MLRWANCGLIVVHVFSINRSYNKHKLISRVTACLCNVLRNRPISFDDLSQVWISYDFYIFILYHIFVINY